jgi:hypothetical protein
MMETQTRQPVEYNALLYGTRDRGTYPTLAVLVAAMRDNKYPADWVEVWACFADGGEELVEPEIYSDQTVPDRSEAEAWIRERVAKVRQERATRTPGDTRPTVGEFCGLFRSSVDDPEEKQLEDYIRTAPRVWKDL